MRLGKFIIGKIIGLAFSAVTIALIVFAVQNPVAVSKFVSEKTGIQADANGGALSTLLAKMSSIDPKELANSAKGLIGTQGTATGQNGTTVTTATGTTDEGNTVVADGNVVTSQPETETVVGN